MLLPSVEVVPSSPFSEMPRRGSPEVEVAKVNIPKPMDVRDEAQGVDSPKIDPRLEDMAPVQATSPAAYVPACGTTLESLTFLIDEEEQKVDYEDNDHDICDNVSEGQGDRPSPLTALTRKSPNAHEMAKVQPSDSYRFD